MYLYSFYAVKIGGKFKLFRYDNKKLKYYDNTLGLQATTRYKALKELEILKAEYSNR
jgi:hypothetical protein